MKPAPRDDHHLDVAFHRLEQCPAVTFRNFPTAAKQSAVQVNGYEANWHAMNILTRGTQHKGGHRRPQRELGNGVISPRVHHRSHVIPAKAGIQFVTSTFLEACRVDSRFRGNDLWAWVHAASKPRHYRKLWLTS
jgi:hypothetical protein